MLELIEAGRLRPDRLLGREITLEQSVAVLTDGGRAAAPGVTVVTDLSAR